MGQRWEATALVLIPVALGLLGPLCAVGGRLCWLAPLVGLPVGLLAARLWERLGTPDLAHGLDRAFGRWGGGVAKAAYLVWGLLLLLVAARRYAARLAAAMGGKEGLYLLLGLALVLWLTRQEGAFLGRGGGLLLLAVLTAVGLALLLTLPGVDWRELHIPSPEENSSLWRAALLLASLAGWGVMGLTIPEEGERSALPWVVGGWALLILLLAVTVALFGPALPARMGEPFLYMIEGAEVLGAFRRGQAALYALLALGDVALLTLLAGGCRGLWRSLAPSVLHWMGWGAIIGMFLLGRVLPLDRILWIEDRLPIGGICFGLLIPALGALTEWIRGKEW